jgi:hypothetical protein
MHILQSSAGRTLRLAAGLTALVWGGICIGATEPVSWQSDLKQTTLVELFTSEGCSSCPSADAWLSRLKESPALWRDFVPVAYHVDYWDHLGWKDGLAEKEFTQRQRRYARAWGSDTIYTPGMVLNGREWPNWRGTTQLPSSGRKEAGVLQVSSADQKHWRISFKASEPGSGRYEITLALLGCGILSDVKAGENRGRKLGHDFVTLKLKQGALSLKDGSWVADMELFHDSKTRPEKLAIAVWVTKAGALEPIQATGGWLGK